MKPINAEDLNMWLDHPISRGFLAWMKMKYEERLTEASRLSLNTFHEKEKSSASVKLFGEVHGLHIPISGLEGLVAEFKAIEDEENEEKRKAIPYEIPAFLNFINKKE